MAKTTRIKKLNEVLHALEDRIEVVVRQEFPIGSIIVYWHGFQRREAEVTRHGRRRDIFVIGSTGREYMLDSWRVEEVFRVDLLRVRRRRHGNYTSKDG